MTRNLKWSLLIASFMVATWATSSEACHKRRVYQTASCGQAVYATTSPTGYYAADSGYATTGGGYYSSGGYVGGYAQPSDAYYGGGYGRPYNPGGLGGPASGLGVRPGLGVGGIGIGR